MARKFKKVNGEIFEQLVKDSFERVGIEAVDKDRIALFARLVLGGIANYFFNSPDNLVEIGFFRFKKNPEKEELFAVEIIKNEDAGVVNADTLYRYYTGDLSSERAIKETMDKFVNELLAYSQSQNSSITKLTSNIERKKRRNQNGF